MRVSELILELQARNPDATVVIDVNADQCLSDRNVLDISEARQENIGDEISGDLFYVFIQATGDGASIT